MDVAKTAQDAAYIAVGLGVIAFQKTQVLRNDLTKTLVADRSKLETDAKTKATEFRTTFETQLGDLRTELSKIVAKVEETLEPVAKEIESRLDEVEARLPEQAKTIVSQARTQAKDAQAQVRALLPV
jgi:vacuolar-type H+-ATPase subunit H